MPTLLNKDLLHVCHRFPAFKGVKYYRSFLQRKRLRLAALIRELIAEIAGRCKEKTEAFFARLAPSPDLSLHITIVFGELKVFVP